MAHPNFMFCAHLKGLFLTFGERGVVTQAAGCWWGQAILQSVNVSRGLLPLLASQRFNPCKKTKRVVRDAASYELHPAG